MQDKRSELKEVRQFRNLPLIFSVICLGSYKAKDFLGFGGASRLIQDSETQPRAFIQTVRSHKR